MPLFVFVVLGLLQLSLLHQSRLLTKYAAYHRDPRNIATHFLGIPTIVFAVTAFLARPSFEVAGLPLAPPLARSGGAQAGKLGRGPFVARPKTTAVGPSDRHALDCQTRFQTQPEAGPSKTRLPRAALRGARATPSLAACVEDDESRFADRCPWQRAPAGLHFPSFRKFRRIVRPFSVRMLSGWNCTPQIGNSRWRTPMISPSSVSAVISRQSGMVSRLMTSE